LSVENGQTAGFDFDDIFALHLFELLIHTLPGSSQLLSQFFLRLLQADANGFGIRQAWNTIASNQVVELFGQARPEWEGVQIFH
jgi:hypothetical protein